MCRTDNNFMYKYSVNAISSLFDLSRNTGKCILNSRFRGTNFAVETTCPMSRVLENVFWIPDSNAYNVVQILQSYSVLCIDLTRPPLPSCNNRGQWPPPRLGHPEFRFNPNISSFCEYEWFLLGALLNPYRITVLPGRAPYELFCPKINLRHRHLNKKIMSLTGFVDIYNDHVTP